MINITRSGNNVIVTSDNPRAFNIANGELSVPLNSIYYVLDDESDFIQFNSLDEKGEILFNGLIGDIQVNGTLVTRDDIQIKLDSVFNASGGGTASAGVNSINGYQGDVNIKTINGKSLIGDGDITIEGGSASEETDPVFTEWKNGSSIAIGKNNTASYNGVNIGTYNGDANTSILIGQYLSGNSGSSIIIGADTKSNNDGEILLGSATKSNTGETTSDKTHVGFAKYGSSYGNESNCFEIRQDNSIYIWDADNTEMIKLQDHLGGSSESDPIFTEWKNADNVIVGSGATYDTTDADAEQIQPSVMIGKGATVWANGIAIGENAYSEMGAVAIGKNITSYGNIAIGSDNEGDGIIIGKNNSGNGIIIGSDVTENYGGIAIGDNISNPTDNGIAIGFKAKIGTKNPDDTENAYGIAIGWTSIAYDKNDVAIGRGVETDATYTTNINNVLKGNSNDFAFIKAADGSFVQLNTEWTGTQAEYDALPTKYDTITYNIIEE